MKIVCIIQCSNLGGMEKVTLESLAQLGSDGHEIMIYSLQPLGDLKILADERGIPISGSSRYKWAGFGNVKEVKRVINGFMPDRLWLVGHNFGSLIAAKLSPCPAYLSIHYHHSERPLWLWRFFYGLARCCVCRIHFVSRYIFEEVQELFPDKKQTICFPNVFSEPPPLLPKDVAREIVGIPENAFVVGNAGWLVPRKAFDIFLETAALVLKQIPEAYFVIAGDGEERDILENQAERLGIRESVLFLGWQKDLLPFYSSLDLLLFNSNFDAMGRTPMEALSHEIPVVCSVTHGGLSEFIRHGQDGFLIDHHDTIALAEAIIHLYRDEDYRKKIASVGMQRILDVGSPEKHLKSLKEFLELA